MINSTKLPAMPLSPLLDEKRFKSILCLDGQLPDKSFFATQNLPVIAADGAANTLMRMGIVPELVIGDLDSVAKSLLEKLVVLHRPDQNTCDYQKSLAYLAEKQRLPAIVCGIDGGSLDHVLNNISLFLQSDNLLYSPPYMGYVLRAGNHKTHRLPPGTKISLIGMPNACVSSTGLQWELRQYEMAFPGANSCFNKTVGDTVSWHIHTGSVLVLLRLE